VVSFIRPWIAGALYVFVALTWLVPDRRIERTVELQSGPSHRPHEPGVRD
jgi:hypothetical protein